MTLFKDLFGMGKLTNPPADPMKKQVWEKLRAKHSYMTEKYLEKRAERSIKKTDH